MMGLHKHLCIPENVVIAMYDYYREGHSMRETARKFKVGCGSVSRCFHRYGYPVRSRVHAMIISRPTRDLSLQMYREWQSGVSTSVIAEKYHYRPNSVLKKIRPFKRAQVAA